MNSSQLWAEFASKARLGTADLVEVVEAVRSIPFGRPADRSPAGVVSEWRGTCSTKHALLVELLSARWPDMRPRIVHRIYRLTPAIARSLFGDRGASVPDEGVTDVHTYVRAIIDGRTVVLDATLPGERWDGLSDMALACAHGIDVDGGDDPWATKAILVARHCDEARERVIEILGTGPANEVSKTWTKRASREAQAATQPPLPDVPRDISGNPRAADFPVAGRRRNFRGGRCGRPG